MSSELAIAQGWHGEDWQKLPEHSREESLRRAASALTALATYKSKGFLEVSGYTFCVDRKAAWRTADSKPCNLTPKEFDLAYFLASRANSALSVKDILRAVWGVAHIEDYQYLRVCLGNLRGKMPRAEIITHRGVGVEWAESV